jgi:hypothetical protein
MNEKLNERDELLLRLRAEGHTYNEIARRLAQKFGRHMTTLFVYRRLQELADHPLPDLSYDTAAPPETPPDQDETPQARESTPIEPARPQPAPSGPARPQEQKAYRAKQADDGAHVFREDGRELDPRLDLKEHSREGFAWAQAGPQAAQLALAILADYLEDDERALELYQDFKWDIVAWLPRDEWELTSARLSRFLEPHTETE